MFTHPKRSTRTILACSALIFAVLLFAQTSKRLLKPVVAAPTIAASSNSPASFANSSIASLLMTAPGSCITPGFGAATNFAVDSLPYSITIGDLNGDGKPDLAVANIFFDKVSVLLGTGTGSFGAATSFAVGIFPQSVAIGDLNGDGKSDLAVTNFYSNNVSVLLNNCIANTPPTITPSGIARTAGAGSSNSQIATASDLEDAAHTLQITISSDGGMTFSNTATLNGVSVTLTDSNLVATGTNPDAIGKVFADVAAACGASNASFTLKVTNNLGATATAILSVNVVDTSAPTITLLGANPMTVECSTGFTDPGATAQDICTGARPVTASGSVNLNVPGSYTITYTANDGNGNTATTTRTVNVVDTSAPLLTLKSNLELWPPNHKYHPVTISQMVASLSDGCNTSLGSSSVLIEKVTSDEPDDSSGDGKTVNDIVIAADCQSVQLRAERVGGGNGRVYVVTLRVRDAAGNTTRKDFKVSVPANQSGAVAVQDATAQTKTSGCP